MSEFNITVRNVGGIKTSSLTIAEGVTVVSGPNASNKTSLLQGMAFALGAESVPIRSGTERAIAELEIDDVRLRRTATAAGNAVRTSGESLLERADAAPSLTRFVSLLEFNTLRAAVRQGDDLRELLTEPLDVAALKEQRADRLREKRAAREELESLEGVEDTLADREAELAAKRERCADLRDRLDELEARRADRADPDDDLQDLRDRRADLRSEEAEYQQQLADLDTAIDRLEARAADLAEEVRTAREEVETYDIDRLRERKQRLESRLEATEDRIETLQTVVTANRALVDGQFGDILDPESELTAEEVTCWTCGKPAAESDIETTLEELTSLLQEEKRRSRQWEPELEEIQTRLREAEDAEAAIEEKRANLAQIEQRLEERRESRSRKRSELDRVRSTLEELNATLADKERDRSTETAELAEKIEDTRVELHAVTTEIDRLERECETLRADRERQDELQERITTLDEEITALTDRIETQEARIRDAFNEAMDDLLDVLGFDDIDRVWLDGEFELVIAREREGTTYREPVVHLAESQREVIGLVLGLAGFRAYDVAEAVPVILLDSLGAFDQERLTRLIDYFADRSRFLVVAAPPDVASSLGYPTVSVEPLTART